MKPYYDHNDITIYHGDCLEVLPQLEVTVDMVLADLPYGTTACAWDSVLPLDRLWEEYKRLVRPRRALVFTAAQPFTTELISSNLDWFKYCWYWEKSKGANVALVNYQPLRVIEEVVVFSDGATSYTAASNEMVYNPQLEKLPNPYVRVFKTNKCYEESHITSPLRSKRPDQKYYTHRHPRNLISISNVSRDKQHPTQKPLGLMEYLIRTYSNEGDLILDNTMGSGTTLRAAKNLGRRAIGIELEERYCQIAVERLSQEVLPMFDMQEAS